MLSDSISIKNLQRLELDFFVEDLEIVTQIKEEIGETKVKEVHEVSMDEVDALIRGLITAFKPVLDDLITRAGFWVSSQLYARVLQAAGEYANDAFPRSSKASNSRTLEIAKAKYLLLKWMKKIKEKSKSMSWNALRTNNYCHVNLIMEHNTWTTVINCSIIKLLRYYKPEKGKILILRLKEDKYEQYN